MNFKKFIHYKDRGGPVIGRVLDAVTESGDIVTIQPYGWWDDSGGWIRLNENDQSNRLAIDLRRVEIIEYIDDYETFITNYFVELL